MTRQYLEIQEKKNLAPYAALSSESKGRVYPEDEDILRTAYMRDRDRIIHSKAFRRLKHKTQVFISPGSDHFRTRLTHTLEVSQIGRTIGRGLGLNEDLIEAIALAHDVGHTPFAHAGEEVLNRLMPGGFKHNHNSVRVLTKIERKSDNYPGLNLSKEVLDGVLHHSGFTKSREVAQTLEGQVIRLSDKIAYVQHDIDDAIRAGALFERELPGSAVELLGKSHGERIGALVFDVIEYSRKIIDKGEMKISPSPEYNIALVELREFMFENVYLGKVCQEERTKATIVIEYLYDYYYRNTDKLPKFYISIVEEEGKEQGIADYISGMSDNFCVNTFKELTIPRSNINI
jgi:dGTPase